MSIFKYIVIPDVHGRDFWRDVVSEYLASDVKFIFLGDYLDPYEYEEIDNEYKGLLDIIEYKKNYPDKFVLLLGNHDLHYLTREGRGSRWDYFHAERNAKTFLDNINLFQMTYSAEINGKKFLFSHAGILPGWLYKNCEKLKMEVPDEITYYNELITDWTQIPDFNIMLYSEDLRENLFKAAGDVSYHRGGGSQFGSIVWADYHEHLRKEDRIPGIIQVFGHTQQEKDPINIDNEAYCLDCRRAFGIDSDGNITELNGAEIPLFDVDAELDAEKKRIEKLMAFFL